MYNAAVLDILIASPSDTVSQREIIRQAVFDWNAFNARVFGVVLLPVMWETHAFPGLEGRAQGMINDQLVNDADILIATFWTRLGSPTGEAESGTVEEITKFRGNGRPIHVYFCEAPVAPLSTDVAQIQAIRSYRAALSGAGLLSSYLNNDQLRIMVRDDLTRRIRDMQQRGLIEQPTSTLTVHVSDSDEAHSTETEAVRSLEVIRRSLRGFLASWAAQYQSLDDYSVDSRHDLMREVATVVFDAIRQVAAINPDASILPELENIATSANQWTNFRVYIDGGVSFNELSNGCGAVLDALQLVIDENWDS